MSEKARLDDAFHLIMKQMVATGQAPFYVELAKELGLSTEEGRQTLHTLFSSGIAGWLHPGTDLVASFAPFNNLPTMHIWPMCRFLSGNGSKISLTPEVP